MLDRDFFYARLRISNNAGLTSLAGLESLAFADWVTVNDNPLLTGLSGLSGLNAATYLYVENNIALPTCEALALQERLGTGGDIDGNDDAGVCP